jgi:hypothetical protein
MGVRFICFDLNGYGLEDFVSGSGVCFDRAGYVELWTQNLVGARSNFEYCTPRLTLVGGRELVHMGIIVHFIETHPS